MRALTIGELETESGVSRSTIYYYVRAGLLPAAQKSSPTRALYTEDHVELLDEIRRLKQEGLDIKAIREQLRQRVDSASANGEDLVARQGERTRRAILQTAAREFARNGYRQTRIADIISELGITPQVLYSHFPTKRDLFAAAYRQSLDVSMGVIEPRLAGEDDLAVHLLWRMVGDYGLRALNPDLLYLSREAAYDDPETTRELRWAHEHVLSGQREELEGLRRSRRPSLLRRAHELRAVRGVPDHAPARVLGRPLRTQRRHVGQHPAEHRRPPAVRREHRRRGAQGDVRESHR